MYGEGGGGIEKIYRKTYFVAITTVLLFGSESTLYVLKP